MPVTRPQLLHNGTPGSKVQLTLQTPKSPVISSVGGASQVSLHVPNPQNQQVTVQRLVSPLVAQQTGGIAPSQIVTNRTGLAQASTTQMNPVSIQGTAQFGATTILAGQQFTIQPRPQGGTLIAGAVSTPLTLTVTSISPGQAILSSSSSTVPVLTQSSTCQVQQVQQFIQRPGVVISQPSVLRGGIPVVFPRGAISLTGNRQQVISGSVPKIIQRPLMSPSGSQVAMQLPSMIGPVIKAPTFVSKLRQKCSNYFYTHKILICGSVINKIVVFYNQLW